MYNRHKVTEGQKIGEMKYWISYKHDKNGQIRSIADSIFLAYSACAKRLQSNDAMVR